MSDETGKSFWFQCSSILRGTAGGLVLIRDLVIFETKVARGNHRAADGFLGQIARYAKIESRGNLLFLKPLRNTQEERLWRENRRYCERWKDCLRITEGSEEVHRFPKKTERQAAQDWPQWGNIGEKTNFCDKKWAGRTIRRDFPEDNTTPPCIGKIRDLLLTPARGLPWRCRMINHAAAMRWLGQNREPLITTDHVLAETAI